MALNEARPDGDQAAAPPANDHRRGGRERPAGAAAPATRNKSPSFEANNNSLAPGDAAPIQRVDGSADTSPTEPPKVGPAKAQAQAGLGGGGGAAVEPRAAPPDADDQTPPTGDTPKHRRVSQSHTIVELTSGDPPNKQPDGRPEDVESAPPVERVAGEHEQHQAQQRNQHQQAHQQQHQKSKEAQLTKLALFVARGQEPGEEQSALIKAQAGATKPDGGAEQPVAASKTANGAAHPLNRILAEQLAPRAFDTDPAASGNGARPGSSSSSQQHHGPRARRASFLQALLLRKWPYLALAVCTMSSLVFAVLLSALSVYTMHSWSGCDGLALAAAATNQRLESAAAATLGARPLTVEEADRPLSVSSLEMGAELEGRGGAGGGGERPARFRRLPRALAPDHYDLFVWPIIAEPKFEFAGKVSIRLHCREATDNITLHALELELAERSVRLELVPAGNGSEPTPAQPGDELRAATAAGAVAPAPRVKRLSHDKQLQYAIIHLEAPLVAGRDYVLSLDFRGQLSDDLAGFYRIKYERPNSTEPTWIAATQFEPTDARRAFPCFDEPLFKATFSIQIKHWSNMTALSNMPIVSSQKSEDGLWITDSFAKSHRMSTYLVAFAVTNFESRTEGNISVWTRPGFVHTAEYALRIAGKILRHYEDFFGIEYPLPKVDMIALPDFNAGAMENWGLITYRETAMLFDETTSSIQNKQRVAVVVAHELAHQWFGNLVTPKWWDDLWLNEGFASFVEYLGVDHVEPQWRMLEQFPVEELQDVLKLDALVSSHQISIPVNNPEEINEIFDHISYGKGASVIRMMNHYLTEEVLRLGLKRYLRALKYDNAEQSDLWAHLTAAQRSLARSNSSQADAPVDVERVMNSWTLQVGYPLVTVTRSYNSLGAATLDQARYQPFKIIQATNKSARASVANSSASLQRWDIPITYTWQSEQNWEPRTRLWLQQNASGPVELAASANAGADDQWLLLNVRQVGYYRVNYDARNWRLLVEQLRRDHTRISAANRAQLLDDMFELARSSLLNYQLPLEAAQYLRNEREYTPWDSALSSLAYLDGMLERSPIFGQWRDFFAELIEPFYARYKDLEWTVDPAARSANKTSAAGESQAKAALSALDSNDVLEQRNQIHAISHACRINEHCIGKAKHYFRQWRQTKRNLINPALRSAVYCAAIENGNKDDWDFLWRAFEKEQNPSERERLIKAMGCSKETWILARYMEWIFDKSKPIRRQDGSSVFRNIALNNYGRDFAFNFMRERWPQIKDYFGKSSFALGTLIRSACSSMNTQPELDELRTFYEANKLDIGLGKRSFLIALEEVESNVLWRNHNYKIIENWLNQHRSPPSVAVK